MNETVKQNFEELMRYQAVDIELKKLNTLIERDEALAAMHKSKKAFNDAKTAIADCEQQSTVVIDSYDELARYIEENEILLAELEAAEAEDEDDLAERVKKLESLRSKFQSAEKKAHDLDDRSRSIVRTRSDAIKTGNIAKQKYNESKEKHGKLVESKASEVARLKAELDKMRADLDPTIFAEYEKLEQDKIFPPVVQARGDEKKGTFNCGGCGIGLSQQANALIKDEGWCRCDHCRRIIVKLK